MKGLHGRKDRLIKEKRHDAYQEKNKWSEPSQCTQCGALFVNGRWAWRQTPIKPYEVICPACRRIADRYPAGYVELKGPFFAEHLDEILNLIHNTEAQEKSEHPLERIMATTPEANLLLVTTTGLHLARRIGEALMRAYKGELTFKYAAGDEQVRVYWRR